MNNREYFFTESNKRIFFLSAVIFILGFIIITRLFYLQIIKHPYYNTLALYRQGEDRVLEAKRGTIEDYNNFPLAVNINNYNLIAIPAEIKDIASTTNIVAGFLGIQDENSEEFDELKSKLSKRIDYYELLKRDIGYDLAKQIKELNLPGITTEEGFKRYYSEGEMFSHLIGFVGTKDDKRQGLYGVEEFFDKQLAGENGLLRSEYAPGKVSILDSAKTIKQAKDGSSLILTIDRSLQYVVCKDLSEGIKDSRAEGGTAIIMNPKNGAVLALCNYPDFDSNQYNKTKNYHDFLDVAASDAFEPGSIFKVITMAAALDANKLKPDTTYEDTGEVKIGNYTIRNSDKKAHGIKTMTNVLEKSLNTGAVFAARLLGYSLFRSYVKNFSFGSLTEIEQPYEATGDISNLEKNSDIYLATASFGQGISVTPIQLATAISAIANEGKLYKPYLLAKIISPEGKEEITQPRFIRQVITPETAKTLGVMMVSVLENGYGILARVPGYYVAGKTGTAQVPNKTGGYSEETIHSFVGFAPAENPVFVGVVKIINPKIGNFAESTAAPIFGKFAKFVLNYYQIPPNRK